MTDGDGGEDVQVVTSEDDEREDLPGAVRDLTQNARGSGREGPRSASQVPDALASADDFMVQRGANREVLPVVEELPGTSTPCPACGGRRFDDEGDDCDRCDAAGYVRKQVLVRPLTQGDANEYLPKSGSHRDLDDEGMLELIKHAYVDPDFSHATELADFQAFGVDPLIIAVWSASGFALTKGMISDNSELVRAVEGNSSRGN